MPALMRHALAPGSCFFPQQRLQRAAQHLAQSGGDSLLEGRNIEIETRFGEGDVGRLRVHAAELVALAPDVIVANTTPVIRALRQATSSIPIVMAAVNDPVEQGLVSSLAHPGGNITGFMFIDFQMVGKWLEMLKEAAPAVSRAVLIFNPDTAPQYYLYLRSFSNAINATLYDKLSFVFLRDIVPVAGILRAPLVLVVHPSFPAKTVPERRAHACRRCIFLESLSKPEVISRLPRHSV